MKILKIIVILSVLVLACGCNKTDSATVPFDNQVETDVEPTGYSDGRFEVSYLYVNGKLYQPAGHQYSFMERSEAEKYLTEKGYEAIGKIAECDVYKLPQTDFTATYLEVGTALYYSGKEDEVAAINDEKQKIEYFTQKK